MIRNLHNKARRSNLSVVKEWNKEEEREEGEMCFIKEVIFGNWSQIDDIGWITLLITNLIIILSEKREMNLENWAYMRIEF